MARSKDIKSSNLKRKVSCTDKFVTPIFPPDEIIKSPLDSNSYKLFALPNGLKVILTSTLTNKFDMKNPTVRFNKLAQINEFNKNFIKLPMSKKLLQESQIDLNGNEMDPPKSKKLKLDLPGKSKSKKRSNFDSGFKGIVALIVGVGSFHDPIEFPGMAHFCEHTITFGSKKYPEKKSIQSLIKSIGGTWKAVTYPDRTLYGFKIESSNESDVLFKTAMDILSDTMANALMPIEWIKKEIHAIDSEFLLGTLNDYKRFRQILRGCAQDLHPVTHFSTGNFKTLNHENLHEELCKWKNKYYKANNMTLAITAPKTIEELEKLAIKYFSIIPSRTTTDISPRNELLQNFSHTPYNTNKFLSIYKIVPAVDIHWLSMCWELPAKMWQNYETKPLIFIIFLFQNGSPIVKYLRENHWILELNVNIDHSSIFSSLLQIKIKLTESGLNQVNQVIETIFSYLKSLQSMNSKLVLKEFNKLRQIQADTFHFHKEFTSFQDVINLVNRVEYVKDTRHLLTSYTLLTNYDYEEYQKCFQYFTPCMTNFMIFSKQFSTKNCQFLVEPWYKTKYVYKQVPTNILHKFKNVQRFKNIVFPDIYTILFKIPCEELNFISTKGNSSVILLLKTKKSLITYSKLNYTMKKSRIPQANYSLRISSYLLNFQNPLTLVWMEIWKNMLIHQLEANLIETSLFEYTLEIKNGTEFLFNMSGPTYSKLPQILKIFVEEFEWFGDNTDKLYFDDIRISEIKRYANETLDADEFCMDFKKFLFLQNHLLLDQKKAVTANTSICEFLEFVYKFKSKMFISVELHGCVLCSDATHVIEIIKNIHYDELPLAVHISERRAMQIPLGENCLRVNGRNSEYPLSIVYNYYQFGQLNEEQNRLAIWIVATMKYPAFLQLRTLEQLSYTVSVNFEKPCQTFGIYIKIKSQNTKHNSGYVDERIDAFIQSFHQKYYCDLTNLSALLKANKFTHDKEDLNKMKEMYDDYLIQSGKYFRKISIQILSTCSNSIFDTSSLPKTENMTKLLSKIKKNNSHCSQSASTNKVKKKNSETIKEESTKLNIEYNVPQELNFSHGTNDYFITDIELFKKNMYSYPEENQ